MQAILAANNAELCEVVCRTHGIDTRFGEGAWTSRTRTPPLYPDAVTLAPDCSVSELLESVDYSAGCSIKDSFASLDLGPYGFTVLFEAEWIVRPPSDAQPVLKAQRWTTVQEPSAFTAWETAWRGDDGPPDVLLGELLSQETVAVIGAEVDGRFVAGAILNRSAEVVGVSNFFAEGNAPSAWEECVAIAQTLFPLSALVGYESGAALEAARASGFEVAGPLRVWHLTE